MKGNTAGESATLIEGENAMKSLSIFRQRIQALL